MLLPPHPPTLVHPLPRAPYPLAYAASVSVEYCKQRVLEGAVLFGLAQVIVHFAGRREDVLHTGGVRYCWAILASLDHDDSVSLFYR